jgi:alkanesulfonate monooxygenase SsuD/methylene tetrahydromethanopterin reductase-like flavin-dependent oxidoreductase (luciferase family)
MRYGLSLPAAGVCDARTLGELAALAEASGWDGVMLEDYLVYQGRQELGTHDPWICLAAMALRTERVVLGMEVAALTRRRPWKVAREAVTLDHLSNGRLILGVGIGDTSGPDFAAFGEETDARRRAAMLDEALEVLVGLWSGEPFSYRGQHYAVDEVTFLPRPLQRPRIPIWVGGEYPLAGPTRRAARWDGSCLYKLRAGPWTPDDVRALRALVERDRPGAPFDVALGGDKRGDDWQAERARIGALAEAGATWWVEYVPPAELAAMREAVARGPLRGD